MPSRLARAFRALAGSRHAFSRGAHLCVVCHRDCVNPVSWDEAGEDRWRVALRCGSCGHEHARELSRTEAARLIDALDRGFIEIETAVERLDRELMTDWVETFIVALERDLIDADDFRLNSRSTLP